MTAGTIAILGLVAWITLVILWIRDHRQSERRFAKALAKLTCGKCGHEYGAEAAEKRKCAGITGPPAFNIRCLNCGEESVRCLRSWVKS
jgi:hypothetical protein